MTQLNLLTYCRKERDIGIKRAERGSESWIDLAKDEMRRVCQEQEFIHSNDFMDFLEAPSKGAWGAVWVWALKRGYISGTGRYEPSLDRKKHAKRTEVYRSLIFKGVG